VSSADPGDRERKAGDSDHGADGGHEQPIDELVHLDPELGDLGAYARDLGPHAIFGRGFVELLGGKL
jgi:hypothetical protein